MRTLCNLLFGILAVLVLLVGGAVAFWWWGGPPAQRWLAHQILESVLDRDVQVDGELQLELGARPVLQLTGLRVAAPTWAEAPSLLRVARAEVQVALRPLLGGQLVLPHLALEGVTVELEIAADGRRSWAAEGVEDPPAPRRASFDLPFLESVSVRDTTIIYRDQRGDRRTRVHIERLTNRVDAASGGLELELQGDIGGRSFQITGTSGSLATALAATDPYPLSLDLQLPSIEATLTGTVADVTRAEGLDLRLQASSPSLRAAIEVWQASTPVEASVTAAAHLGGDLRALAIDEVAIELRGPGVSRLSLAGGLLAAGLALDRLDLTATLDVPDPSPFADQLGFDPSGLGALHAEAELSLADRQFQATRLKVDAHDLDQLQLDGHGVVGELDPEGSFRLAPDLEITASTTDSQALLGLIDPEAPDLGPVQATGRLVGGDQGWSLDALQIALGTADDLAIGLDGRVGPLVTDGPGALPLDLSATLEGPSSREVGQRLGLDLPELGAVSGRAGLDGTIASLRIRDAQLETRSGAGIVITAKGGVSQVQTEAPWAIEGIGFELDARAPSTTVAAGLFDQEVPDLGPVQAQASLEGDAGALALSDVRLIAGSSAQPRIQLTGKVGDALALRGVTLAGEVNFPTTELLALADLAGGSGLGRVHGELKLSDAKGPLAVEQLEAETQETDLLTLTVTGSIDDLQQFDRVGLTTSLAVPSIAGLAGALDVEAPDVGPFSFDGQLSVGRSSFDADGRAVLGESHFEGTLGGDLGGARPSLRGQLQAPRVRLADLGLTPSEPDPDPPPPPRPGAAASGPLFGPETLPLIDQLSAFDLDLKVELDDVQGVAIAIDRATAQVQLADGVLRLSPLRFVAARGQVEVDAEVDARGATPGWQVQAKTDRLELRDLVQQLGNDTPLSGKLDLDLDLNAQGRSPRELAESLGGDLNVELQNGRLASRLLGLTIMNPLRWLIAPSTRRGYSTIDCLVARFDAADGVAKLRALVLDTPNLIGSGKGQIDFARETIDLRIKPHAKQGSLVELSTGFSIKGDLADPSVVVNSTGAAARALARVAAAPVNLLGSLLPFVGDHGRESDSPCKKLPEVTTAPS